AVALSLTIRRPELIRSVIVHEPPLVAFPAVENDPEMRTARRELEEYAKRFRHSAAADAAREFAERYVTGPGGFDRLPPQIQSAFTEGAPSWPDELGALVRADVDPGLLGGIDLPALVSRGTVSPRYLSHIADAVAKALPNAVSRDLVGAGHFPHVSHPALYGGTVLAFALERNVPVS
ncbi:MAG: alpha/beta hydrolase, partial [Thermoplasmata archaeon]|nr:alpha/beta hydrolase [Thermoplasmata archaeon]